MRTFAPRKGEKALSTPHKPPKSPSNRHKRPLDYLTHSIMDVNNAQSQMRKGMLEFCILLLLHQKAAYANDIIARLKEKDMIVVEGTLYPLLTRLKKDGLLQYEWQESTQGPPRKYYALTTDGEVYLSELNRAWEALSNTIAQLNGER